MGLMEGFKNMLKNWLEIQPSQHGTLVIQESLDFNTNVAKNRIWHRGDPYELEQLYKNLKSELGKASFWASVPVNPIHKIHTGLPALITDTLVSIVIRDMNSIEFKDSTQESVWNEIAKENNLKEIIEDALSDVLVMVRLKSHLILRLANCLLLNFGQQMKLNSYIKEND